MAAGELQVTGGFESADHEWTPCCGRDDPRSTVKGQIPEHGLGQCPFLRLAEVAVSVAAVQAVKSSAARDSRRGRRVSLIRQVFLAVNAP